MASHKILTFDVGGTAIKYGVCDSEGHISFKGQEPTPNRPDSTLDEFIGTIKWIYQKLKDEGAEFEGIAMAVPGCVNADGSLRTGGAIAYNYGAPIADLVAEATGMRPVLENDAKAAAAAELWIGSLQGVEAGAVLILGTGLGGGLIVDGKVYQGPFGAAGELSAFIYDTVNFDHPRATEAQNVSTSGLVLRVCDALGLEYEYTENAGIRKMPLDGRKIFELYHQGNEVVIKAIEDFGYEVGKLIYNLSVVLNLQKVAIGGGISAQDCLIEAIKAGTDKAWRLNKAFDYKNPLVAQPEVTVCQFHNDANLIGAMYQYLVKNHLN